MVKYKLIINLLVLFICIIFLNNCKRDKTYRSFYYIPNNYEGWVNIYLDISNANSKIIYDGNKAIYFLNKNLDSFAVSNSIKCCSYIPSYYYKGEDSLIPLHRGYPKSNIHSSSIVGYGNYNPKTGKYQKIESFYVTKKLVTQEFFLDSILPYNPRE